MLTKYHRTCIKRFYSKSKPNFYLLCLLSPPPLCIMLSHCLTGTLTDLAWKDEKRTFKGGSKRDRHTTLYSSCGLVNSSICLSFSQRKVHCEESCIFKNTYFQSIENSVLFDIESNNKNEIKRVCMYIHMGK